MKRRDFVKSLAAAGAMALSGCGGSDTSSSSPTPSTDSTTPPPNILFVLVDEMRYPVHFPQGVNNADEYLARFMPNLHRHLWQGGVRFDNYRTAAGACTPSRSVLMTGLYTQQTWVLTTITGQGSDVPPSLSTAFPTYGSLLQAAGYETPYFGKFHVADSVPLMVDQCQSPVQNYLAPWGFTGTYVCPDPAGRQGQGDGDAGQVGDADIADAAINWFTGKQPTDQPWCATVSFVNPHDYEFFWGGTEPSTYMDLFAAAGETPLVAYNTAVTSENDPPPQGFPATPANWESMATLMANKPKSQRMFNEGNQAIFSGVSFDPNQAGFSLDPSPIAAGAVKKGVAPFSYWQRGSDSYAQLLGNVDVQIGRVLDSLTPEIRANTVVIFSADHGDYVGSHGFSQGKVGTCYEEALRVPFIVRDFTGRFATQPEVMRHQLTSSVDLVRFLVTLGYGGDSGWISGELAQLYAGRFDILSVVRDANAPGRDYAIYTTDEYVQPVLNFNASPTHIIGLIQGNAKLGVYSFWAPRTTQVIEVGQETEFYDWSTPGGAAETDNTPGDPRAGQMLQQLLSEILPNEVRKPVPASMQNAQAAAEAQYLDFVQILDLQDSLPLNLANTFGIDGFRPGS